MGLCCFADAPTAFQNRGIIPPKCPGEVAGWGRLQESQEQRCCCDREVWKTGKNENLVYGKFTGDPEGSGQSGIYNQLID